MSTSLVRLLKVDVYDQFYSIVQMNHGRVKKDIQLAKDEAVALHAYTKCYPPLYIEINSALRDGQYNHFLIKLIDSALSKLPNYDENIVYRWTVPTLEEQRSLENEGMVTEYAYVSTLKLPNEIDMAESDCWLVRINHINGKDIALYSDDYSVDIQEVLIPRGSVFQKLAEPNLDYDLDMTQIE
jgi:hypothetical protein